MEPSWELTAALGASTLLLLLLLLRAAGRARRANRGRQRHAQLGEEHARDLLERSGYVIEARQERAVWWMVVDGDEVEVEVRCDFVVSRDGRRAVAEVKTGELAPDPTGPATRRQLLEYALVFGLDDLLLVDAEADEIHSVAFPRARR